MSKSTSAKSLPIWGRMITRYPYLRTVLYAQNFCAILCRLSCILDTTPDEREMIAHVAAGGAWE